MVYIHSVISRRGRTLLKVVRKVSGTVEITRNIQIVQTFAKTTPSECP